MVVSDKVDEVVKKEIEVTDDWTEEELISLAKAVTKVPQGTMDR